MGFYERSNYYLIFFIWMSLGWSCRSMVDRKITGLEVAGSSPVTITFYQKRQLPNKQSARIHQREWNYRLIHDYNDDGYANHSFSNRFGHNNGVSNNNGIAVCTVCIKAHFFGIICDSVYFPDGMRNEVGRVRNIVTAVLKKSTSLPQVKIDPLVCSL